MDCKRSIGQVQSLTTFWRFKDLPTEIRLAIWKRAIPSGRVIRLDMDWDPDYARTLETLSIPSILHVCRESRQVATGIYQLGFGVSPTDFDQDYYDPAVDTLYISPWAPPVDWTVSVAYDFTGTFHRRIDLDEPSLRKHFDDRQHKFLARVRHLAVPLHEHCGLEMVRSRYFLKWLAEFPELTSVSFLIDHFEEWHRTGDLVLCEPEDTPIRALEGLHPSEIELNFVRSLEDYRDQFSPGWKIPTMEVLVMSFKPKNNAFCVPHPDHRIESESSGSEDYAL